MMLFGSVHCSGHCGISPPVCELHIFQCTAGRQRKLKTRRLLKEKTAHGNREPQIQIITDLIQDIGMNNSFDSFLLNRRIFVQFVSMTRAQSRKHPKDYKNLLSC